MRDEDWVWNFLASSLGFGKAGYTAGHTPCVPNPGAKWSALQRAESVFAVRHRGFLIQSLWQTVFDNYVVWKLHASASNWQRSCACCRSSVVSAAVQSGSEWQGCRVWHCPRPWCVILTWYPAHLWPSKRIIARTSVCLTLFGHCLPSP